MLLAFLNVFGVVITRSLKPSVRASELYGSRTWRGMLLYTQIRTAEHEITSNDSNIPRGNNQNGNGYENNGNGYQGKPGNPPPGTQGNQNNQPKQAKRPADGDSSKPSKKHKTSNDSENK